MLLGGRNKLLHRRVTVPPQFVTKVAFQGGEADSAN